MEKITYGAPRLVDWVAQIKIGYATVRVHFTGGAMTAYGVTPAEYTTTDRFIQTAIEKSDYYKSGRIVRLRVISVEEKEKPVYKPKIKPDEPEQFNTEPELVETTCLQDAQAYLKEKFCIQAYKVRSVNTAYNLGLEHGVKFTGPDFDEK